MSSYGVKSVTSLQQSSGSINTDAFTYPERQMWADLQFEYTGYAALTVIGSVTGKTYRFSQPGDQQLIDYRDVKTMMALHLLKVVEP